MKKIVGNFKKSSKKPQGQKKIKLMTYEKNSKTVKPEKMKLVWKHSQVVYMYMFPWRLIEFTNGHFF